MTEFKDYSINDNYPFIKYDIKEFYPLIMKKQTNCKQRNESS